VRTTTIVIGAGHSGLAMSHSLSERSIDHVVLDGDEIGAAWRRRWPSLRLLTPNWQTRLPGWPYTGSDPDGYMPASDVAELLVKYAADIGAPVREHTLVRCVRPDGDHYRVETDNGSWTAPTVVVATGAANQPAIPSLADALPTQVTSLTPDRYHSAHRLPDGGVLVVGASATGVQLAADIRASGRPVIIAVGEHVRLPRRYRERDIFWWLDGAGVLDERYDEVDDLRRVRRLPSPQLIGSHDGTTLDLNALSSLGVQITGRLVGLHDGIAQFSGGLANCCALADLKLRRLLDRFDQKTPQLDVADGPAERPDPTRIPARPITTLNLRANGIDTVLWATGFKPDRSWLPAKLLDSHGELHHNGGVVAGAPGLYLLGAPVLRRRRSTYISGAEGDTADLAEHMQQHLS
jgi:putative flavoprotein involved in K+ transport